MPEVDRRPLSAYIGQLAGGGRLSHA
jgi:hypothetical protein